MSDVNKKSKPSGLKGLWAKILETIIENIAVAVGGFVATAAIAGAVAAWAALKTWVIVEIPSGVVVASIHECRDLKGGWTSFDAAGGRFIVGAGAHPQHPGVTKSYTAFISEGAEKTAGWEPATGGEEKHRLTIEEMPAHDHTAPNQAHVFMLARNGFGTVKEVDNIGPEQPNLESAGRIQSQGGNQPHSVIPPYVALYYCQKS